MERNPINPEFKPIHQHNFCDQQYCMKCGKWEGAPEADDCIVSHVEYVTIRLWQILMHERIRLKDAPQEWLAVLRKYTK